MHGRPARIQPPCQRAGYRGQRRDTGSRRGHGRRTHRARTDSAQDEARERKDQPRRQRIGHVDHAVDARHEGDDRVVVRQRLQVRHEGVAHEQAGRDGHRRGEDGPARRRHEGDGKHRDRAEGEEVQPDPAMHAPAQEQVRDQQQHHLTRDGGPIHGAAPAQAHADAGREEEQRRGRAAQEHRDAVDAARRVDRCQPLDAGVVQHHQDRGKPSKDIQLPACVGTAHSTLDRRDGLGTTPGICANAGSAREAAPGGAGQGRRF